MLSSTGLATRNISSLYSDTAPPTPAQSQASSYFFRIHQPRKQWVATEWRRDGQPAPSQTEPTGSVLVPEVAFLGRSNAGKSSLLNALLQSPLLCRVGPKPGKTTAMHAWMLCPSDPITGGAVKGQKGDLDPKLTVLDMPGYGHGSRTEWGQEIVTYLKRRKQLRRAMVLINPVHGLKRGDEMILQLLRAHGIVHQIVASKCDGTKPKELTTLLLQLRDQIREGEQQQGVTRLCLDDILAVGGLGNGKMNKDMKESQMSGMGDVGWTVLRACGLDEYAVHKFGAEAEGKGKQPHTGGGKGKGKS